MGKIRFALFFAFAGIIALSGQYVSAHDSPLAKSREFSKGLLIEGQQSAYPPAFLGSEWAFGLALFSLVIISALAIRHLILILGYMIEYREPLGAPITVTRLIIVSLLVTVITAVTPDAVLLLAWGEVNAQSITFLAKLDRVLDGLAVVPFAGAVFMMIRGEELLHDQLLRPPIRNDLWPTFEAVRHHIVLILLVVVIALGVTIGK